MVEQNDYKLGLNNITNILKNNESDNIGELMKKITSIIKLIRTKYEKTPEIYQNFVNHVEFLLYKYNIFTFDNTDTTKFVLPFCSLGALFNVDVDKYKNKNKNDSIYIQNFQNCLEKLKGSCGDPSLIYALLNNNPLNNKLFLFFVCLYNKLSNIYNNNNTKKCKLHLVLGSENNKPCNDHEKINQNDNNDELFIVIDPLAVQENVELLNKIDNYDDEMNIDVAKKDEIVKKCENIFDENKNVFYLKGYFPLHYNSDKKKKFLDYLIFFHNNNDNIHLFISNKMCGSCFPSLWYLIVKCKNISYSVCPEQTIDEKDKYGLINTCGSEYY